MPRINHNIPAMITSGQLSKVQRDLGKSLERLSTGLRINRASDDAAGLSVSESLRTQVRGSQVANRNANDGIALLKIAEGAANEISAMLQRMRELSVQSDNDTLTTVERQYLDQEFQALTEEITRISAAAQYNGQTLIYGGEGFGVAGGSSSILHIGANNVQGVDRLALTITSVSAGALSLTTESISTNGGALSAITAVDLAIQSVNRMRSDLGAYINRLEHAVNNLDNQTHNMQAAESTIRDVDFAEESTMFMRNQILNQSATAMLSQANNVPQSVLSLLQG
ncbi:MAG: flagellin [Fibrobacteres bacterium]|nr:flagellin [Fibrobacterota bacterium]